MPGNNPADTNSNTATAPERVFVEIPRAKPGQGYHAPKNYDNPLLALVSRVVIVALCLSLPVAPALIFLMIYIYDPNARTRFLWIWIPLTLFILLIGVLAAYGVAREALGVSGVDFPRPAATKRSFVVATAAPEGSSEGSSRA